MKTCITNNMPFLHRQEFRKERDSELKVSSIDSLKMAGHHIVDWKVWGRIVNLIMTGTIYGFRILMFIIDKIIFLSQRLIERFRKHS